MSDQLQDYPVYRAFECIRFDSAAGDDLFPLPRHSHYFSQIVLARKGSLRIVRGSMTHLLKEGELLYIGPLIPHSIESEDGNPVVVDIVKYSGTALRELPSYITALRSAAVDVAQVRLPIQMAAEDVRRFHLGDIVQECFTEYTRQDFGWDLHIRALLYLIITALARFWFSCRDSFADLLEKHRSPVLDVPAYIEQHISEPLRVEDLAAMCGMSYPWFAKQFHEYFGVSCKQIIERLRVEAVERYLIYSDLNLAEISSRTGYTDCSHMVKDFRRLVGLTPGQFRTRVKNQSSAPISHISGQTAPIHPPKG